MGAKIIVVEKIKTAKLLAERDIAKAVAEILSRFERETELTISGLVILTEDITTFSDEHRHVIVTGAEIEISRIF